MNDKRPLDTLTIEGGRISLQQLFFLCIIFVISTADIFLPNYVADVAREDAWISVIIGTAASMVTVWLACKLQLRVGRRNIVDSCDTLLGHILGRIVSLLYIITFITIAALIMRELNEIMLNVFLMRTPILAVSIAMILVAAYGAFHGLETFSRVSEILTPLGILILILVILFNITDIQLKHFTPILYHGIMPSLHGGLLIFTWLSQVVIIVFMVTPYLREFDYRLTHVAVSSVAVLGIMMMLGVLAIAIFGPERTAKLIFPALYLVRNIDIHDFIQRLDAFIFAIWVGGITVKMIMMYYFSVLMTSQWFRIPSYKTIIPPIGVLIILISIVMFPNLHILNIFFRAILPYVAAIFAVFIPLLLLVISYRKNFNPKL
ncbi:GerAB/ArcD/ProY family transporter [Desulfuribacillus alkaliarsenatis]|uniref:Uncharacterized protein n=1 Tax=Desulfuribacillus alkaliarsenatis TaxID=766136 RepID=A0A1E5G4V2_9FIRM|nr:endospore germination permease [Desulfuribacillus alkaliarsenatis]OEF98210.1 hypothetical protein BHF68_00540 [Desulfuribacillus alkaliarsenatis]